MWKKTFKKMLIITTFIIFGTIFLPNNIHAADWKLDVNGFNIMPELEKDISELNTDIQDIWSVWWHVWDTYNKAADAMWQAGRTDKQIASWIMNWDTIMNYLVFIVQFLSQLWLVVWALFIMYAGYKYITSVLFQWKWADKTIISNAIIWILVVIFSYAIMKILTSLVWLS